MSAHLAGKTAIITGASSGIGAEAALLFAEQGAHLVLHGRDAERGQHMLDKVRALGAEAVFIAKDIGDAETGPALVAAAEQTFGGLDILYNNAGGSQPDDGPAPAVSDDVFWRTLRTELYGTWSACRAAIPALTSRGGGAIINTASVMGAMGIPNRDAYTAAKGGIIALTRSLAVEYAADRIRVNVLVPGATETDRVRRYFETEPHLKAQADAYLLGLARPRDVARAALYLATDAQRMTGQALPVDSGLLIS